jgi:hypothetical protein
MQKRPWLTALLAPAALAVALLASNGNANPPSHTPTSAYTRILADSGSGNSDSGNSGNSGSGNSGSCNITINIGCTVSNGQSGGNNGQSGGSSGSGSSGSGSGSGSSSSSGSGSGSGWGGVIVQCVVAILCSL